MGQSSFVAAPRFSILASSATLGSVESRRIVDGSGSGAFAGSCHFAFFNSSGFRTKGSGGCASSNHSPKLALPKKKGATQWCNGYSSYEALDNSTKERIQGLKAVHRHSLEEQNPDKPATHPLACTHPETGRKTLYLGPHLTRYIVGVDKNESKQILDKLFNHISQPQFVWTHHWHLGDFVIWDNRCTMHRREGFSSLETRLLKRTQVFNNQTPY